MAELFILVLMVSFIPLALAIISAFIGTFQDDKGKSQFFSFAAKSLLVFAVMSMVGFGGCLATLSL